MTTTHTNTASASDNNTRLRLDASIEDALQDYKIHHSHQQPSSAQQQDRDRNTVVVAGVTREAQPNDFDPSLAPHPTVPYPVSNPNWWTDTFRRVPDYRPINTSLDLNERRQMLLFTVVGGIMVRGCWLISIWAQLWRNTAGRLSDVGKSHVGGEW